MTKQIKLKHIGVDSFFAMRNRILSDYENAKIQTTDDAAKVEHGNIGEAAIRNWLSEFLPKRFGVCKGYIITTNLNYQSNLEEWDIIIYDALEAPILFIRDSGIGTEKRRAIPVEYVRGIIEVKSKLTIESSKKATEKLKKLKHFIGENESEIYPTFLTKPFVSLMMFMEVDTNSFTTYQNSLNNITDIYKEQTVPFMGALVLKTSKHSDCSGYLRLLSGETATIELLDHPTYEMSKSFKFNNDRSNLFGSLSGYTKNSFPEFIFDMLAFLKGNKTNLISSFYGRDHESPMATKLFS